MILIKYTPIDPLDGIVTTYGYDIELNKVNWQVSSTYFEGIQAFHYFGFA
jgi:hypothetical protein